MLTQEQVLNLFDYDYSTGNLVWKNKKNTIAGTIQSSGYRQVSINGKRYLVHQIIWLMFNGSIPKQIDHINRIKNDNRIENLRLCEPFQNMKNRSSQLNRSSSFKGVRINNQTLKWRAAFSPKGKSFYLGEFVNEINAALAYDQCVNSNKDDFTFLNFPELQSYWQDLTTCKAVYSLFSRLY